MDKKYLNINELSVYLGLKVGTIYVWVCQRKIPYIKLGRLLRFDIKEIDDWMKSGKVNTYLYAKNMII
jgi:excisionase family DNA binding protein